MVFDLDPSLRWAFCMTHPDDEISICAWMKRLVDNGNPVFLSWTHSTPQRELEGRAAAGLMGLPSENLRAFGAPDGDVVDHIAELIPQFEEWFRLVRPDRVVCGAFEQGHLDHDSTNYIVNHAFEGPVYEVPFYHTYLVRAQRFHEFAEPTGQEVRRLTPAEQKFRKLIARQYPSQNIWTLLLLYEALQTLRMKRKELVSTERMRLQTHKDFLSPSLPPRLAERVRGCAKWQRWEGAVAGLEDS